MREVAPVEIVNGGGTGSLHTTARESRRSPRSRPAPASTRPPSSTATTTSRSTPAAMFALPVVRRPSGGVATLLGGGYLASGAGRRRSPARARAAARPAPRRRSRAPARCRRRCSAAAAARLRVGDNVYLRHAKAGELCERFDSLYLLSGGRDRRGGADVPRRGPDRALVPDAQLGRVSPGCLEVAMRPIGVVDSSRLLAGVLVALALLACAAAPALRPAAERRRDHDRRPDGRDAADDAPAERADRRPRAPTSTQAIASFPLCCPSRATNLTGQYAHNHGVLHNAGPFGGFRSSTHTSTCRVWLQAAGYRTMHVGRYLNGYEYRDGDPGGLHGLVRKPALRPRSTTRSGRSTRTACCAPTRSPTHPATIRPTSPPAGRST